MIIIYDNDDNRNNINNHNNNDNNNDNNNYNYMSNNKFARFLSSIIGRRRLSCSRQSKWYNSIKNISKIFDRSSIDASNNETIM